MYSVLAIGLQSSPSVKKCDAHDKIYRYPNHSFDSFHDQKVIYVPIHIQYSCARVFYQRLGNMSDHQSYWYGKRVLSFTKTAKKFFQKGWLRIWTDVARFFLNSDITLHDCAINFRWENSACDLSIQIEVCDGQDIKRKT